MTDCTIQGTAELASIGLKHIWKMYCCWCLFVCPIWIIIEDNVGNDNGLGVYL